ncbi:MAG: hypothetical protein R3A10_02040 [Caldilineaceae bacterium]
MSELLSLLDANRHRGRSGPRLRQHPGYHGAGQGRPSCTTTWPSAWPTTTSTAFWSTPTCAITLDATFQPKVSLRVPVHTPAS